MSLNYSYYGRATDVHAINNTNVWGRCLVHRDNGKNYYSKLVHDGSVHAANSHLMVRWNDINYRVADYTESQKIYDDCGEVFANTGATFSADGISGFSNSGGIKSNSDRQLYLPATQAFTVHFRFKGDGSSGYHHIFSLHTDAKIEYVGYQIKSHVAMKWALNAGAIHFIDHFHEPGTIKIGSGSTSWHDYQMTFHGASRYSEYDETNKCDKYPVNYTIYCDGASMSGTTYFTVLEDYWRYAVGVYNSRMWSTGTPAIGLKGTLRYLSVSQSGSGYSTYRRSDHRLLLHCD